METHYYTATILSLRPSHSSIVRTAKFEIKDFESWFENLVFYFRDLYLDYKSWDTLRLLGAIETPRNRAVYVSLNTNANPTPNPNTNPNPN